jgi:hypothetical protein
MAIDAKTNQDNPSFLDYFVRAFSKVSDEYFKLINSDNTDISDSALTWAVSTVRFVVFLFTNISIYQTI